MMIESIDVSHKLAYAGARSPVPFITGPEYANSVPGVPVLSMLRIFIEPKLWSFENVAIVAKEICRILGPQAQFDIGMTLGGTSLYGADRPVAADTARLMKMEVGDPRVLLRFRAPEGMRLYEARFPSLRFEETGDDFWQALYAPGAVKEPTQP